MNRIVAAAIEKNGVVFTGTRHGNIIRDMVITKFITDMDNDYVEQHEQGFIDLNGEFWNREQSRDIAVEAGQVSRDHKTLYSEDLW